MLLRRQMAIPLLLLPVLLGACSWFGTKSDDVFDYRSAPRPTRLDVPPDLSQIPKDDRFAVPAAPAQGAGAPAVAAEAAKAGSTPVIAPGAVATLPPGSVAPANAVAKIVRSGASRWLEAEVAPEVVYVRLKAMWERMGWKIAIDDPAAGVLETEWTKSRSPVNEDAVRGTLQKILGMFASPGEQSRLRARFERTGASRCNVTIVQRLLVEEPANAQNDQTIWTPHPGDGELEAEMLQRLANELAPPVAVAAPVAVPVAAVAVAPAAVVAGPASPSAPAPEAQEQKAATGSPADGAKAPPAGLVHKVAIGGFDTIQIEDAFDRAWRRLASALDRAGFTVEDRNREKGQFFVRYLDPEYEIAEKEKRNWWDRVFHSDAKVPEQKFQIHVSASGHISTIEVLNAEGHPDAGVSARHIIDLLIEQLR